MSALTIMKDRVVILLRQRLTFNQVFGSNSRLNLAHAIFRDPTTSQDDQGYRNYCREHSNSKPTVPLHSVTEDVIRRMVSEILDAQLNQGLGEQLIPGLLLQNSKFNEIL